MKLTFTGIASIGPEDVEKIKGLIGCGNMEKATQEVSKLHPDLNSDQVEEIVDQMTSQIKLDRVIEIEKARHKRCKAQDLSQQQVTEFLTRLEGPEGCDFREKVEGDPASLTWNCDNIHGSYKLARAILTKMSISAEAQSKFLSECEEAGGYCDCEILFNARLTLLTGR